MLIFLLNFLLIVADNGKNIIINSITNKKLFSLTTLDLHCMWNIPHINHQNKKILN